MSDYSELERRAQAAIDAIGTLSRARQEREFNDVCTPQVVKALIAENKRLKGPHDWLAEDLIKELVDNAQAIQENADDGEENPFVIVLLASASRIRRQEANIDQLRAEVSGLRTGYEAYEQVNAELKAENEALRKDAEQWRALVRRAESPVIGYTGCVTCGVYTDHGGLSCPKMRATADAALGQGGESNECS